MSNSEPTRAGILRRVLLALLVCVTAALACPAFALAVTSPEGYTYEVELGGAVITGYTGTETQLSIPSTLGGLPVTGIGEKAFSQNHAITEVSIPEGVTSIADRAFNDCTSLAELSLPGSLASIGESAFYTCSSLVSLELPAGVTSIGDYAFTGCLSLTSASVPGSVNSWGTASFAYCVKLASVTIGQGVTEVPERAFKTCTALTSVNLADSVKTVGRRAFELCSNLETIDLSNVEKFGYRAFACSNVLKGLTSLDLASATDIAEEAFSGQSKVASISIPKVQTIGRQAFGDTLSAENSTSAITLPASATNLADGAFQGCKLSRVEVDAANTAYKSVDGVLYTADGSALVTMPACWSGAATYEPAAGTTRIAGGAFAGVEHLEKVTLPASVTEMGEEAFANAEPTLTEVDLSPNLTAIPARAFYGTGLTSVTVPGSVRSIGESAFAAKNGTSSLEHVTLEEGVQTIERLAFADCSMLESVSLPSTLTSVDPLAFYDTRGLEKVTLAEGGTYALVNGNLLTDGGTTLVAAFGLAANKESNTYTIPDGVTTIKTLALEAVCAYATHVPDSVVNFEENSLGYEYTSLGVTRRRPTLKVFGSAENTALTSYLKENDLAFFTAEPTASCTELTLAAGQTGSFTLSGTTSDFVVYASSNNSVATVDENGTVTAVAGGEADIFACVSQIYFSAHVTVTGEAAADPYADYVTLKTSDEADAWGSAYEAYNNGNAPTSTSAPSTYLYTTDNYPAINGLLDAYDFKAMADAQYGAGEYGEFADAGQNSASELGQYAVHENTVAWSGLEHSEFVPGGIANLANVTALIGQEITFQPITSTSLLRSVAVRFASTAETPTILQVYVPKGTTKAAYIGLHSAASDERELTIAPGAKLKVIDAGVSYFPFVNPLDDSGTEDPDQKVTFRYIKVLLLDDDSSDDSGKDRPDDKGDDDSDKTDGDTDENDADEKTAGEKTDSKKRGGKTPSTGDVAIPVGVVALAGVALVASSRISRHRSRHND